MQVPEGGAGASVEIPAFVSGSPGLVSASFIGSLTNTLPVYAGPPALSVQQVASQLAGLQNQATVTVCTGATNGAVTATTSTGTLASATSAITVPAPGCGDDFGGTATFVWTYDLNAAPSATWTLAYAGSPNVVAQPVCAPGAAPGDAGLGADSAASMWMNAGDDAGASELLVDVTLTVEGGPLAGATVSFVASAGTPATGTFTTDSNGRGFVSLSIPAGVSVVDLSLSVPGGSNTLTFSR